MKIYFLLLWIKLPLETIFLSRIAPTGRERCLKTVVVINTQTRIQTKGLKSNQEGVRRFVK